MFPLDSTYHPVDVRKTSDFFGKTNVGDSSIDMKAMRTNLALALNLHLLLLQHSEKQAGGIEGGFFVIKRPKLIDGNVPCYWPQVV